MAFTKAQLEALAAQLLASSQPIAAVQHRAQVQTLIDELFSAQSRGNVLAGVQGSTAPETGDTALVIRGGQAFLVPLSSLAPVTLAGLQDVVIIDPEAGELMTLIYNSEEERWENVSLAGAFVTQEQLDDALAALQLPQGARLISADLVIISDTSGEITAAWVDGDGDTNTVSEEPLTFNTAPAQTLPAPGNFRFDIIQGLNNGTVNVKQGTEGDENAVTIPTADAGAVVLAVVLWSSDGTAETEPPAGNTTQNVWSILRFFTETAPNTTGKFAKIWEGPISISDNKSMVLAYAEPKNASILDGAGAQILKMSFTATSDRNIIADSVQLETSGGLSGDFRLVQIAGNRAALYHRSSHFWGRIQFRVLFQNSSVNLNQFENNQPYGAAPTAVATYNSRVAGEWQERENNTVLFDKNYIIGNASARTGNILFDFTGAKLGAETEMRHADASAFVFDDNGGSITIKFMEFTAADISTTEDNYFLFVLTKKSSPQIVKVFHALEGEGA